MVPFAIVVPHWNVRYSICDYSGGSYDNRKYVLRISYSRYWLATLSLLSFPSIPCLAILSSLPFPSFPNNPFLAGPSFLCCPFLPSLKQRLSSRRPFLAVLPIPFFAYGPYSFFLRRHSSINTENNYQYNDIYVTSNLCNRQLYKAHSSCSIIGGS